MNFKAAGIPQLIARLALGIGFLLPVADRAGILGLPGSKGIVWGDWQHFTAYAHTLMPVLPTGLSNLFAFGASGLELIFGCCLIAGLKTQLNALGGAILTALFAICMMLTQGLSAPFNYPVFVFVGAGLLLACIEHPKWSIDAFLDNRKKLKLNKIIWNYLFFQLPVQ